MRPAAVAAATVFVALFLCQDATAGSVLKGDVCTVSDDCVEGTSCAGEATKHCECMAGGYVPVTDNSKCLNTQKWAPTNTGCTSNADCSAVNGSTYCVAGQKSVCICDMGNSVTNDNTSCIVSSGGGMGGGLGGMPADDTVSLSSQLNFWLLAGASGVAAGIMLTVGCVALILSGFCSGDPYSASAGRPRGMDGFRQLPFIPKKYKLPEKGSVSKKASLASIKSKSSVTSLKEAPNKVTKKGSTNLFRGSSNVDHRGSRSEVDPSMSMSQSGISMSELSGAQTSTMVSEQSTRY